MIALSDRAFVVSFTELSRWDPGSFLGIEWHWPSEVMRPIGSVLRVRKEKADRNRYAFADLQPITIHFDGSMDRRKVDAGREYTMDLLFARPGDIVVAKIDLKNGAVGIVPSGWESVVVTGHFAVYEPDLSQLLPQYLHLIIQSPFFKAYLWRNKVGAEGRKEVKLDFFESVEIPLPPLPVQQAIVACWQRAQEEVQALRERVAQRETQLIAGLKLSIGRLSPTSTDDQNKVIARPKAFAIWWKDLDRWGVEMAWHYLHRGASSHYPTVSIKDVCKIGSGGTPSRASRVQFYGGGIPWVKTTEVRNNVIFDTEETLTQVGLNNSSAKVYPAGSLIIAMYGQGATRGRTAKLGVDAATNQACAVLTAFANTVDPDYLWFYLQTEYDSLRLLASGNNQPNLNAGMIADYPLPLPPLDVQAEIVRTVQAGRAEIARERERADTLLAQAKADVEAMILGTMPPPVTNEGA